MSKTPIIYVVSDSVGETAELVTKAAISQFEHLDVSLKRFPYVEDKVHIDEVISMAKHDGGMIAYTLVKPDISDYLQESAAREGIYACDIIGPLMKQIQTLSGETPLYEPGLVRKLDEDYFKKVEAIEFAVKYDDGRDPRGILKADIVLVGVSRTSKPHYLNTWPISATKSRMYRWSRKSTRLKNCFLYQRKNVSALGSPRIN